MNPLADKRIVLAVTGSIAAVDTVRLAHELRRRGADVIPVMSAAACDLISPETLTYACGHPCITKITGMVEHVYYCGEGGHADLLLIAPSTANTIAKIASGIDDTPVTTFATTAIGRGMPVVLAPAMHESMYRHPIIYKHLQTLQQDLGITIVPPKMEEERAKIAEIDTICRYAEQALTPQTLQGKRVVITSGACRERVDSVRVLTTRSSGTMGRELAKAAFRRGADVTLIANTELYGTIPGISCVSIESAADMRRAVLDACAEKRPDYYVSAAAISDFVPESSATKLPSGSPITLQLNPAPKLLAEIKNTRIIAFKLGEDAEVQAQHMLAGNPDIAAVAANRPETMGAETGTYTIYRRTGEPVVIAGTKSEIADTLWNTVL